MSAYSLNALVELNPKDNFRITRVVPVKLGRAHGLDYDNGSLWVIFSNDYLIHKVDIETGKLLRSIRIERGVDPDPHGLCVHAGKLYYCDAGFPPGSMHLRESTTWRTVIPGNGESRAHKLAAIERLLEDFPLRRFLLIGDSGELDPEIYGEVARTWPERVEGIVIRDVTGEGRNAARYASAFAGVPSERWHIFRDGGAWPLN